MIRASRPALSCVGVLLALGANSVHAQAAAAASAAGANEIKEIKNLLTDSAAGHVSAASLLGLPADAVTAVENTRGLVAAVKGTGTGGTAIGISLTPARTSITPMNLTTYDSGIFYRLLGNTALSYAQGSAKVGTVDVQRRAYAIETSVVFDPNFDPIIGYMRDKKPCKWEAPISQPGQTEVNWDASNKAYTECVDEKLRRISAKWNASRGSISFGSGTAQAPDRPSTRLGRTLAASLIYGFDHFGISSFKDSAALSLTYRRTIDAPILESLVTPTIKRTDTKLMALRFTFGGESFRGLIERSNASERDASATQRLFKHAYGADIRLGQGMWLALRQGKQKKINGTGEETVTLLDFSYSFADKFTLPKGP